MNPSAPARTVLLTTFGSLGDVNPYLAVARALQARGLRAILATSAVYRDRIEGLGIPFRPLRPDVGEFEGRAIARRVVDQRKGPQVVLCEVLLPALRASYEDTWAAAADADLLVCHPLTMTTRLVAEKKGLPWVSTCLAPLSFFSRHDPPVLASLQSLSLLRPLGPRLFGPLLGFVKWAIRGWFRPWHALRAELGLPPAPNPVFAGLHSPHLALALFSSVLGTPQPDWPKPARLTGFPFFDEGAAAGLKPALARFLDSGPPPIVFTLGSSAVYDAGAFYRQSAAAAARLGRRAVLLLGWAKQNLPDSLPPGVCAFPYAPFSELLPRAAAVVHQGGVGTIAQVLRAGRPMLVVPFAHDQPDNADRVRRLGVAGVVPRQRYSAGRAAAALRPLLEDPGFAQRAAELGRRVRAEDGAAAAAEALEGLLRKPLAPVLGGERLCLLSRGE
jgi:UDP:flavonoid glycosyltransferase YjiC (YdhE family)